MNTTTLYTDTCSNWINTLIKTLNGNLRTFTRHTGNLANSDKTVANLRNLSFKKTFKK